MEERTANTTEIEKEGIIGLQQDTIKAAFQSNGAVAVGIVSFVATMIIGGVTISYSIIILLAFFLLLGAVIYLYFDQQKKEKQWKDEAKKAMESEKQRKDEANKAIELEKQRKDEAKKAAMELKMQRKDEAWRQMDSDRVEVEKLLSDSKDQILAEISVIENDWPVQTQSTNKLKNELNKLYEEIHDISLKISSEASKHKTLIYACNSGEWNHVLLFRKIQEDAIKQCETKNSGISVLKKKFKLTDSAALAETTRQTAKNMGYLLRNEDNDLQIYKLPLQLTNTYKKIRRFEYGADTGSNHRYLREIFLIIVLLILGSYFFSVLLWTFYFHLLFCFVPDLRKIAFLKENEHFEKQKFYWSIILCYRVCCVC